MKAPFDRWELGDVARDLARALSRVRAEAEACARELHTRPHGPIRVFQVPRYGKSTSSSPRTTPFARAFPSFDDFLAAVQGEDAGALETAVEVLSRVAPDQVLPIARALLEAGPWEGMLDRLGSALARVDDRAAVALALEHADLVDHGVGHAACPDAADLVLARLTASPVMNPEAEADRYETMLVEALLAYLGKHRVKRAWSTIATLYEKHPDEYVRLGAGHALLGFADDPSHELLARFVDSDEERRRWFAVSAYLARDAAHVVAQLGGLDALRAPGRWAVASALLEEAARGARESTTPIADPLLLDLALAWVRDPRVKDVAQWVLDAFGKDAVKAAKKRLGAPAKKPRAVPPKKADVAAMRLTMDAARGNLERIVAELRAMKYVFRADVPLAPVRDRSATTRAIEKALGGPLPLSLRMACEIIGACDLTGTFPGQSPELESDAFVLLDAKTLLAQARDEGAGEAQVSLAIAPDAVGKAGFSGGQEVILAPDPALDARVLGVAGEPLFVERLRHVFRCGGFPGLDGASGKLRATVTRLRAVCVPI